MPLQHLAGLAIAIAILLYAGLGLIVLVVLARAPAAGDEQAEFAQLDHELTLTDAENIHDYVDPAVDDRDELDALIRGGVAFMNEENARRAAAERDCWERGLQ